MVQPNPTKSRLPPALPHQSWPVPPAPAGRFLHPLISRFCRVAAWIASSCAFLCCSTEKSRTLLPAELSLARSHIDTHRHDLALAILAHQPDHPETKALLATTAWFHPATALDHPGCDIVHFALRGKSLWVALAKEPIHTLVRWNLDTLEIENILFPAEDSFRHFQLSPTADHAVVSRGDVSLIIDARTLKPIAHLGKIPDGISPESIIIFSADSLLLAHPTDSAWLIRDTATGEIIRNIPVDALPASIVLAAHLDHKTLRLLNADGGRIDIPTSPVEPIEIITWDDDEEPLHLLHAHIIHDGHAAIGVQNLGPHQPAALIEIDLTENHTPATFDVNAWAMLQTHSAIPGIHTGLLRHFDPPPIETTPTAILFHSHAIAPLTSTVSQAPPAAGHPANLRSSLHDHTMNDPPSHSTLFTADPTMPAFATAHPGGRIVIHRQTQPTGNPTRDQLESLARHQYDRKASVCIARDSIPNSPDPATALVPLDRRIGEATSLPHDSPSHQLADALAAARESDDLEATIQSLRALLESTENPPASIRTIAESHLHLLLGDTATAFAPYHHGFPDLAEIRQREDWQGWESPDFQPAVEHIRQTYQSLLTTLTLDPDADEAARIATLERLGDPASMILLGRPRYALACLDAAQALTAIAGEAEQAIAFASLARNHGAPEAAVLRVEARAHTALGHFPEANTGWVKILSDHPLDDHLAEDYAEAAYTAFEIADPRQAIAILITGMHRFGANPSFALRCGWIALLTDHPNHARAFLLRGLESGYPQEELEHATLLLAVAAALGQDNASAAAHFQDLIAIDPSWATPEAIDALAWPEHLATPLRSLTW